MTAEEFLDHISENGKYTFDWKEFGVLFAKYHTEQALKFASENAELYLYNNGFKASKQGLKEYKGMNYSIGIDKDSILSAYPLENIN
jgi:hypothetical protein